MADTTSATRARVLTKTVSPTGQIQGLKPLAGRDVLVVPLPKIPDAATPAKAAAKDLADFARAHADLARKQAKQFLQRHGNPVDKAQAQAERIRKELEERYAQVRVRVLPGKGKTSARARAAKPATRAAPKKARKRAPATPPVAAAVANSENGTH